MTGLKGVVEVVKYDAEWDESLQKWQPVREVERFTKTNNIAYKYFYVVKYGGILFDTGYSIAISEVRTYGPQPTAEVTTSTSNIQSGVWTDRVPLDPRLPATTLGYFTFQSTFDPPSGSSRYIGTIAIMDDGDAEFPAASVALTELCEQTTSQLLNIYYRVYVDDEGAAAAGGSAVRAHEQGKLMFSGLQSSIASRYFPMNEVIFDWFPATVPNYSMRAHASLGWTYALGADGHEKWEGKRERNVNISSGSWIGRFFASAKASYEPNSYGAGRSNSTPLIEPGVTAIQSVFPKAKASTVPYLDTVNAALGTGDVLLTETTPGTSWAPDHSFAAMYRMLITADGDTGTSTYRIAKQLFLPTSENTFSTEARVYLPTAHFFDHGQYVSRNYLLPPCDDADNYRHGISGTSANNLAIDMLIENMPFFAEYRWPEFLSFGLGYGNAYDNTNDDLCGVTIHDLNGNFLNLNSTTTPALPISNTGMRQVVSQEDGTIWVACEDTGLWKITRAGGTTLADGAATIQSIALVVPGTAIDTVTNSTSCRAVVVKKTNGVAQAGADIWAIFDKELCHSVNDGVDWVVYDTTGSQTGTVFALAGVNGGGDDASGIRHMEMDHHHIGEFRFFIVVEDIPGTTDGKGFWWSDVISGGNGVALDIDAHTSRTPDIVSFDYMGPRSIYAAKDTDWFFAIGDMQSGIIGFTFGTTTEIGEQYTSPNVTNTTRCGQGIMVFFDENGDDWIVGFDETNSSDEMCKGRRPANVFSTANSNFKTLCWRARQDTTNVREQFGGLSAYLGYGVWLTMTHVTTAWSGWSALLFYQDSAGGMDSSGVVTDPTVWEEYGWNGAWTKDDPGSKTTHTSTDAIIDGLSIAFVDDAGNVGNSFKDVDMYDGYAFRGVLKDNATVIDYNSVTSALPLVHGTSFVDAAGSATTTVPAVAPGTMTDELSNQGYYTNGDYFYGDPGTMTSLRFLNSNNSALVNFEQVFQGDFTIDFKMNMASSAGDTDSNVWGFRTPAESDNFSNVFTGGYYFIDGSQYNPWSTNRFIGVGNGTANDTAIASTTFTTQKTNSAADDYFLNDDEFRIQRTGTDIVYSYKRFGAGSYTTLHTVTGISTPLVFGSYRNNREETTLKDIRMTYTDSRLFVFIGDNSTVGPGIHSSADGTTAAWPDPNFRCATIGTAEQMKIEVDTTGGGNWVERTIVTNQYVEPSAGQVLMTHSGKVVFHSDDVGRPFRGNWIYQLRQNVS